MAKTTFCALAAIGSGAPEGCEHDPGSPPPGPDTRGRGRGPDVGLPRDERPCSGTGAGAHDRRMAIQETTSPALEPVEAPQPSDGRSPLLDRDPEWLRRELQLIDLALRWHATEVRGIERIPREGPVLIVGNHNGGIHMPDAQMLFAAVNRHRGFDNPTYFLGFDVLFAVPGLATALRRAGVVPASNGNAKEALERGAAVVVYPGGDWEASRPYTQRHQIHFHHRRGFVRLALDHGVPVVPVVAHGSHESVLVLTRGDRVARALGLQRSFRVNAMPIQLGFPFGVTPGFPPNIPLPTKVTLEVQDPLDWSMHFGRSDDDDVVQRCYDETIAVMQAALTRLARQEGNSLLARVLPRRRAGT